MDHVAIMKKSWGLLPKIISGEKTIESRWYKTRRVPWGKIKKGDAVYFKNSGEAVTVKATVEKVLSFEELKSSRVKDLLKKYGSKDGIPSKELDNYYQFFIDKKYCLLIFLKEVRLVRPFQINKKGFGTMSAWITITSVKALKGRSKF